MEEGALVLVKDRWRPERRVVHLGTGHGVDANRFAVVGPRRQPEDVVRQGDADDIGRLREDLPDVERFRHRVEQAIEGVETFAAQPLGAAQRVVANCQRQDIGDPIHQDLVGGGEGVGLTRREPQRAVNAGAAADGADDARARIGVDRAGVAGGRIGNTMPGDFHLAIGAGNVQHHRFDPIEPEDVQPLERNRLADERGQARHELVERGGFRRETGDGRQHCRGIDRKHWNGTQYNPGPHGTRHMSDAQITT